MSPSPDQKMRKDFVGQFGFVWLGAGQDVSVLKGLTVSDRIRLQFQQQRRGELKRPCSVLGCGTVAIRLDGLCYRHKGLRVRNGHAEQPPGHRSGVKAALVRLNNHSRDPFHRHRHRLHIDVTVAVPRSPRSMPLGWRLGACLLNPGAMGFEA